MDVTEKELEKAKYKKRQVAQQQWEFVKHPPFKHRPPFAVYVRTSQWEGGPWLPYLQLGELGGTTLPLAGIETLAELETLFKTLCKGIRVWPQDLFDEQRQAATPAPEEPK